MFGAFLCGVLLTLVLCVVIVVYIGRRSPGSDVDKGAATIQFAVEDFIDDLGDKSDEYLQELHELLSRKK